MTNSPDKYICAHCRKKFSSRIRPPIDLGRIYNRDGCRFTQISDIPVISCSRPPAGQRFEGSPYACSPECYEALTGDKRPRVIELTEFVVEE